MLIIKYLTMSAPSDLHTAPSDLHTAPSDLHTAPSDLHSKIRVINIFFNSS
jgi:hypothetical protein